MTTDRQVRRWPQQRLGAAFLATLLVLLVAPAQPASASATLDDGEGFFTANATATSQTCATYTDYTAALAFDASADSFGSLSSGTFDVVLESGTEPTSWGEFADGTRGATNCPSGITAITGFTGVATNASGTLNCELGHPTDETKGTYLRNGTRTNWEGMDITYTFNTLTPLVTGGCLGETAPVVIKTTITDIEGNPWGSDCDAEHAPDTCDLGPAGF